MTFSSSPLPLAAFVEQPLPGCGFSAEPVVERPDARAAGPHDAEAALRRAEEAAFERGRAAGREETEATHAARLGAALAALDAALGALREREREQEAALARSGLALALAAAAHLLRRELAADASALAPCLAEAFDLLAPEGEVLLALAPDDLARIRAGGAEPLARIAERWNARLVTDPKLGPGEARAEAAGAQVELRWDAVIARLEAALRERLPLPETPR